MNKSLLSLAFCLLLGLGPARAATTSHQAIAFSATIFTSVSTGTDSAALKVTHLSNAILFNQLVASGSFGSLKATDMDLVTEGGGMVVIDKMAHTTLFVLGTSGTDHTFEATVGFGKASGKVTFFADTSFLFKLPDGTTWNVNGLVHVSEFSGGSSLLAFSYSFLGGLDDSIMQGTLRKRSKVYIY